MHDRGMSGSSRPGAAAQAALRVHNAPRAQPAAATLARLDPPAWRELRALLAPAGWSEDDLLSWVAAPNAYLEGCSPADTIRRHPHGVTDALRVAANRAYSPLEG